jgi:hypothetical protein
MWKRMPAVSNPAVQKQISHTVAICMAGLCLAAACLALFPAPSLAGWFPSGRVTHDPANSITTTNNAWCVAAGDSGAFHIVWEDSRDGNAEVYYKFYDGFGWSPGVRLSAMLFDSEEPALAAGDSGKMHVVWSDRRDGFVEIYYKRYDGTAWGPDQRLTVTIAESRQPSVCAAGGKVHVVWIDRRTGTSEVYYKCHDGFSWSSDTRLSSTAGVTFFPSVAADDSGRVHVVWYDYALGHRGIYYARYDGAAWSAQEHITPASTMAQNPSIALDDSGHVHVVWYDYRDLDFEIYYKTHDGTGWSADLRLTDEPGTSHNPSIALDGAGVVNVVWHDYRTGQFEIYHSMFDGMSWSDARVLSDSANSSFNASIAAGSDNVGVVWYDDLGGNGEIFWTRTYEGPFDPPQVTSVAPDSGMSNEVVHGLKVAGSGFIFPDSLWLEMDGEPRVVADSVIVASSDSIVCRLDLTGVHYGRWDLVVRNPDGQTAVLDSAFKVKPLPEGPYITSVFPEAGMAGTVTGTITIVGGNFTDPVSVWFLRDGEVGPDAFDEVVETERIVRFRTDLGGADPGAYDVVIQNPDGKRDTLAAGFRVLPGWSDEVRITDYRDDCRLSRSNARSIAADPAGMLHVVWFDYRHGDPEIYYRRHNGSSWDAEQRLTNSMGLATDPAVAADGASDVHVVWTDTRLGPEEIFYMKCAGGVWGPETCITDSVNSAYTSGIAADDIGNLHVAWCDERDGAPEIYYRKHDGMAWGPAVNLSNDSRECSEPSIDVDGLGTVHVAWVAGTSLMEVYHIANDGTWGGITQLSNAWRHVRTPCVDATASGNVYVAWREELASGVHDIFVREYDGAVWQPFEQVTDMGACGRSAVAADEDGNIHLAWRFYFVSGQDLYYKMYDGSAWTTEAAITNAVTLTDNPSLTLDGDYNVHMVWEDDAYGHFDIYYARRDAPGLAGVAWGDGAVPAPAALRVVPNPVVAETALRFRVPSRAAANVAIYDIRGRCIWSRTTGEVAPGEHSVPWARCDDSGDAVSPGVYFARLEIGGNVHTAKLVVVK